MDERAWRLDGVVNFRDFGGCETQDGRRVRTGRLFRSAHFSAASAGDVVRLNALGAAVVADLRNDNERIAAPSLWPGEASRLLVCGGLLAATAPPGARYSADNARAMMIATYRRIAMDGRVTALLAEFFAILAETGGPAVAHCTAGKDRTGIVCAVVLSALGVGREAIFADYLLTNTLMDVEARRRLVRANLAEVADGPLSDEDIAPLVGVEEGYLAAALAAIDEAGGMEAYLARIAPPVTLGLVREQLLAP